MDAVEAADDAALDALVMRGLITLKSLKVVSRIQGVEAAELRPAFASGVSEYGIGYRLDPVLRVEHSLSGAEATSSHAISSGRIAVTSNHPWATAIVSVPPPDVADLKSLSAKAKGSGAPMALSPDVLEYRALAGLPVGPLVVSVEATEPDGAVAETLHSDRIELAVTAPYGAVVKPYVIRPAV